MRVRTEEKRQEIVQIAGQLFEEQGFERTSMSQISERVGGSKATLYGYFKSKEELLIAVLDYDVTARADELMNEFLRAPTLRDGLIFLGKAYLYRRLDKRPISNVRIVSSQPEDSGIGKLFYERVLEPAWRRLCTRLEALMDEGVLKRADPWVAAMQWKGLNEWDLFDRRLLGATTGPDPQEIELAATTAADAFLKLYAVEEQPKPKPKKSSARGKRAS